MVGMRPIPQGLRYRARQSLRSSVGIRSVIMNLEIAKLHVRGIIGPSDSAFAAPCVCIREKDRTSHFCQDYRWLDATMATDSGGLGDRQSIIDRVKRSGQYSTDSLSGHFRLEIKEYDKHNKTAFRDADGSPCEYSQEVFGLYLYRQSLPTWSFELLAHSSGAGQKPRWMTYS